MITKPTWLNHAIELKNGAYIEVGADSNIKLLQSPSTVEVLFKLDTVKGVQPIISYLATINTSNDSISRLYNGPLINVENGRIITYRRKKVENSMFYTFEPELSSQTILEPDQWYHLVLNMQSGKNMILFLNGIREAHIPNFQLEVASGDNEQIIFGAQFSGNYYPTFPADTPLVKVEHCFNGLIGFIRVWNMKMGPGEFDDNRNNEDVSYQNYLVANFNFNALELKDQSANEIPFFLKNNAKFTSLMDWEAPDYQPFSKPSWMEKCLALAPQVLFHTPVESSTESTPDFMMETWVYLKQSDQRVLTCPLKLEVGGFTFYRNNVELRARDGYLELYNFKPDSVNLEKILESNQRLQTYRWYRVTISHFVDSSRLYTSFYIDGKLAGSSQTDFSMVVLEDVEKHNDFFYKMDGGQGFLGSFRLWALPMGDIIFRLDEAREAFLDAPDDSKLKLDLAFDTWPNISADYDFIFSGKNPSAVNAMALDAPDGNRGIKLLADGQGLNADSFQLGTNDFTIESWIKTSSPGVLFSNRKNNKLGLIAFLQSDGRLGLEIRSSSYTDNSENQSINLLSRQTNILNEDHWHHVAFVRRDSRLFVYLNGSELGKEEGSPEEEAATQIDLNWMDLFTVGNLEPVVRSVIQVDQNYFIGSMDEIRVWGRALTVYEIRGGMNHVTEGIESGLLAHWSFDQSNAEDTSPNEHHATVLSKTEFTSDVPGLARESYPYLMVQSKLMEDYHIYPTIDHPDGYDHEERDAYRVVITALQGDGQPIPNEVIELTADEKMHIHIQGQEDPIWLGPGEFHFLNTNVLGQISFGVHLIEVTDETSESGEEQSGEVHKYGLYCPHVRVRAGFFQEENGWLIVAPDRSIHHGLANITSDGIMEALETEDTWKGVVAKPINNLMKMVVHHDVKEDHPLTQIANMQEGDFDSSLTNPSNRKYEHVYTASDPYLPESDVMACHYTQVKQPVKRLLNPQAMEDKHWIYFPNQSKRRNTRYSSLTDDQLQNQLERMGKIQTIDPLAEFLANPERGDGPLTPQEIQDLMDTNSNHKREIDKRGWWSDLKAYAAEAVTVIVHTEEVIVQHVEEEVVQIAVATVKTIENGAIKTYQAVVHTAEEAGALVEGLIEKVEGTLEDAVDFLKGAFNWSQNIIPTQRALEWHIEELVQVSKNFMGSANLVFDGLLDHVKAKVDEKFIEAEQYFGGKQMGAAQEQAKSSQPQSVQSSYLQHHFTSNQDNLTIDEPNPVSMKLDSFNNHFGAFKDHLTGTTLADATFNNNTGRLRDLMGSDIVSILDEAIVEILEIVKELLDGAIDLLKKGVDLIFNTISDTLDYILKLLKQKIKIPYVAYLYKHVISGGEDLTLLSLISLLGAIPASFSYQLVNGVNNIPYDEAEALALTAKSTTGENDFSFGKYYGWDGHFTLDGESLVPMPVSTRTSGRQTSSEKTKAKKLEIGSVALGTTFSVSLLVWGGVKAARNILPDNNYLSLVDFVFEAVQQLASFPIYLINYCTCPNDNDPVCVMTDDGKIRTFLNACYAECEGFDPDKFVDCTNSPENPESPGAPDGTEIFEAIIWSVQNLAVIFDGVNLAKEDLLDLALKSNVIAIYGGFHLISFLGLGLVELGTSGDDTAKSLDSAAKLFANMVSTITEVDKVAIALEIDSGEVEAVPETEKAVMWADAAALGVWGVVSLARVIVDGKNKGIFHAR